MTVPKFEGGGIISFYEKDVPVPGAGQLLLQVGANALCGSERGQFYDGSEGDAGARRRWHRRGGGTRHEHAGGDAGRGLLDGLLR